jgi:hypothetical protein
MIISQEVFSDNIKGTYSSLVDKSRVDGSMYGDTKLYYAVDILKSHVWNGDDEAGNLLALDRPKAPSCQAITINQFRQIRLTVDNYLTKRAWSTEGAFSSFNSVMLGMIRDTKRIYDSTLYNTYIGTVETDIGKQSIEINPVDGQNDALTMAEALATLLVDLKDVSRDYNDYGYVRSYEEGDLRVVWNAKVYNTLKKIDLPVIFHKDGLLGEFEQEVLPARYFGKLVGSSGTTTVPVDGVQIYRTLVEGDFTGTDGETVHLLPGDVIPEGATVNQAETYMEDNTIAFKLMHKRSVPYMSAFEVSTSFFNPRSLTENNYLTYGYNDLEYLYNYPMITARFKET